MQVAQVGNSSVIAAAGPGGSLQFYWQPIGSQQWNQEQVAGPGSASGASVAQVGNSSVIAAAGRSASLQFWWQPIGSQQCNQEQVAGPGSVTLESPSVAQVGKNTVIAAAAPGPAAVVGGLGSLQFYWQPIGSQQWNSEQVAPAGSVTGLCLGPAPWPRGSATPPGSCQPR